MQSGRLKPTTMTPSDDENSVGLAFRRPLSSRRMKAVIASPDSCGKQFAAFLSPDKADVGLNDNFRSRRNTTSADAAATGSPARPNNGTLSSALARGAHCSFQLNYDPQPPVSPGSSSPTSPSASSSESLPSIVLSPDSEGTPGDTSISRLEDTPSDPSRELFAAGSAAELAAAGKRPTRQLARTPPGSRTAAATSPARWLDAPRAPSNFAEALFPTGEPPAAAAADMCHDADGGSPSASSAAGGERRTANLDGATLQTDCDAAALPRGEQAPASFAAAVFEPCPAASQQPAGAAEAVLCQPSVHPGAKARQPSFAEALFGPSKTQQEAERSLQRVDYAAELSPSTPGDGLPPPALAAPPAAGLSYAAAFFDSATPGIQTGSGLTKAGPPGPSFAAALFGATPSRPSSDCTPAHSNSSESTGSVYFTPDSSTVSSSMCESEQPPASGGTAGGMASSCSFSGSGFSAQSTPSACRSRSRSDSGLGTGLRQLSSTPGDVGALAQSSSPSLPALSEDAQHSGPQLSIGARPLDSPVDLGQATSRGAASFSFRPLCIDAAQLPSTSLAPGEASGQGAASSPSFAFPGFEAQPAASSGLLPAAEPAPVTSITFDSSEEEGEDEPIIVRRVFGVDRTPPPPGRGKSVPRAGKPSFSKALGLEDEGLAYRKAAAATGARIASASEAAEGKGGEQAMAAAAVRPAGTAAGRRKGRAATVGFTPAVRKAVADWSEDSSGGGSDCDSPIVVQRR